MHPDDPQFDEDLLRHLSVEDFDYAANSHKRYMQGHKDFEERMKNEENKDAGINGEGY